MTDEAIQELREEVAKLRERVAVLEQRNQTHPGIRFIPAYTAPLPVSIPHDPLVPPWHITCSVGVEHSTPHHPV